MKSRIFVNLMSLSVMLLWVAPKGYAQFSIQAVNMTPQQLVNAMLTGEGVEITNAQFNRSTAPVGNNIGTFSNLHLYYANDYNQRAAVDWPSGIIMTTGAITTATTGLDATSAPSNQIPSSSGVTHDTDLVGIGSATASNLKSLTMLEFDFTATSALVQFDYIFASKEYPTYANSNYNDVFAFHISGRDPVTLTTNMKRNIALLPNLCPVVPVTINSVNNGNNSGGGTASHTGSGSQHPEYFFDNRSNAYTNSVKYGGFTVELTASAHIIACYNNPYHMSLSLADVTDNALQSAVFIKKGSFKSPTIEIDKRADMTIGNDTIMNACNSNFIDLRLPKPNTRPVHSVILGLDGSDGATAIMGVHYTVTNMQNGSNVASGGSVNFTPATVVNNPATCFPEFSGGDTLIQLRIDAIQGALLPGEVRIAKVRTTVEVTGGARPLYCMEPVATDTLIFILKGYEELKFRADTFINSCDQFTGEIATGVNKGFLKSVTWDSPAPNFTVNSSDSLRATVTALTDTTIFTIYGVDRYDCSRDTTHIKINIPKRPVAAIQTIVTTGCSPFKFSPSSLSVPDNARLRWVASEGQTSAVKNPAFILNKDTMIWLYAYSADYCYDSTFVSVKVYQRPHAEFNYLPFEPLNGRPIEFYNASTGDISDYKWNFGDGTVSSETNPVHTYHVANSELFNVQLIATAGSIDNCADTTLQQIAVEDRYAYYVPTAFTPNGDGVNDEFIPRLTDAFDYTFMVYNRWGALVFFSNEIGSGWDGKDKNGNECEAGVYVWKINFKKYADPNALLEYKGMVTLVR